MSFQLKELTASIRDRVFKSCCKIQLFFVKVKQFISNLLWEINEILYTHP